jgi:hypothetical protein
MAMSKKDYQLIARAIDKAAERAVARCALSAEREYPIVTACMVIGQVIDALVAELERDNPLFDRQRFIDACDGDAHELGIG